MIMCLAGGVALFLACSNLLTLTLAGGVYPNYRAHFDFAPLDAANGTKERDQLKWWQTASLYQIYPRSYKDSNGDGVGDLNGITSQLPYLKEIGIDTTWLSPICTSPMADFGYDIANYTEIDAIFGTMADFKALIAEAKRLGLKIILDFVPNHTSDESMWFKQSAARNPEYIDYYVWHPGRLINGKREPPTNWVSVFHGSAWTWHEGRQEYYLHQFLSKQPDLNYRNPKVQQAMKNVLKFWLEKGVMGFRIDAVPFIFERSADAAGNFPDEPHNADNNDPTDYGYLQHIYTIDQPETIALIYDWRKVLQDFQQQHGGEERIFLVESYSSLNYTMQFYGNATADGAQLPFNFQLIYGFRNDSNAYKYAESINIWLDNMPKSRTPNWVLGNHDQNRVGSRLGSDRIDMLNILIASLPGVAITYQGEEIGMTDVWISWKDTVDPSACNTNPQIYERFSRDPERTPFQWSDEVNAGFSTAKKTWLPVAENYRSVNVRSERENPLSHLNIFKQLRELRKDETWRTGDVQVKAINEDVLGVIRKLLHDYTYVTLVNIFDKEQTINLSQAFEELPTELEYVLVTDKSTAEIGQRTKADSIQLHPKEAIILRSPTKLTTTAGYYTYYLPEEKKAR